VVLQQPDLAKEERFSSNSRRNAARDELSRIIIETFSSLTAADVVARLDKARIANARANDMHEVWKHPQLKARSRWREVETARGVIPALLPPGSWEEGDPRMDPVPALGEHTERILSGLGYAPDQISRLRVEKVI
jgi:crotonobetainyl-CoA:carnitine CoA-transferase CaiB-like acyl-CoA transferase